MRCIQSRLKQQCANAHGQALLHSESLTAVRMLILELMLIGDSFLFFKFYLRGF